MQQRIQQFAGQVVTDLAAAMAGVMTNLGHKLGLYRAMAESGPIKSDELARRTVTNERSVREWLNGQVAGGYVLFAVETKRVVHNPVEDRAGGLMPRPACLAACRFHIP